MRPVSNIITRMEFGHMNTFERLSIVPINSKLPYQLKYLTLPEVQGNEGITISEASESGLVEELSLTNNTDKYLLLLDGEELVGAKQNRAINSSIMAAPKSVLPVPVSCTEQGRWSYMSRNFTDSGSVMPMQTRYNKKRSVDFSLKSSGEYKSNQSRVWDDIEDMRSASNTESPTRAMKDLYTDLESRLNEFVHAFRPIKGQTGILVLIDGKVASLEVFSKSSALRALLPKLIKSYAMHVLLEETAGAKTNVQGPGMVETETHQSAERFKASLGSLDSQHYKSLGEGWDYRFTSASITGSALVYEEEVIHAVFYNEDRSTGSNRK